MKKKIISVLLCVALAISVTPIVYAQDTLDSTTPITDTVTPTQVETEPYIVGEIIEKRTADTKHFLMSDRSIMAAMYDQVVHYRDDGAWVDIDNSFSTNSENEFENKSNGFKTKFSKKSNGNKLVTIKKDNYSLSWMLDDADKVDAQVSQSNESASEDISVLKNLQGSVTYPDIQNDVDLQYVISGNNLKENIILQSADAPTEYSFTYKFSDLKYRTNDSNQIEFYDKASPENTVFTIDTPHMCDSGRAYSNDVEMQIAETSNGFTLKLIPNEEWLLSEDRVYPIVIDPTILSSQTADDIWDIDIRNTQTSAFSYTAADFLVGSDSSGQVYRSLIKFPTLPSIDTGGIVVNAKIYVSAYQGPYDNGDPSLRTRPTDDIQVNIHRINLLWPEEGATWSSYANSYDPIVEDYFIYNDTSASFSADITKLVNAWYEGTSYNYGIMLKAANESAANHVMQFTSSDWGINDTNSATWRPCLTVNYRTCVGLEDYWSYTTQSMGGYGTGYVNNYNGNLVYTHDDVSFNSIINGFTLSHVYNSANSKSSAGRYGIGWRLNLTQTFEPTTIKGNDSVKFVYTDGDGTKHYFIQLEDNSIVDEDGLGYTYSPLNGTEIVHQITDKDKNILKFDQWGALRRIIDPNGNTINLNYSPVPNQFNYLSSITTSSGGTIALTYDSNYMLTSITDNAGRVTSFDYTSGTLTKITYPDGTDLEFSYDWIFHEEIGNSCWLTRVTLPNGYQYSYNTTNDKITTSAEISASGTQINDLSYTYQNNQTKVEDAHERHINYQFDSFGRVTCVYDSDGNSYSETYTQNSDAPNKIFSNNKLSLTSNNVRYINNLIANPVFSDDLASWTPYKEAPNETQISVVSDQSYISSKSVKITSTASSIQALLQNPTTTAGKTYTLSANIKTENVVSATHGVGVEIVTSSSNGTKHYYSDFILGTTDTEINNGFVTARATAAMASGENIIRISVGLYNASGTVWIDSVQLEEGDTANKINLISNSSFEKNSGLNTLPIGFTGHSGANIGGANNSVTLENGGSYTVGFVGNPTAFRSARQAINISGKAGDVFSYGGWAKAHSIPAHTSGTVANFQMCVKAYYADNTTEWFSSKFDINVSDWQYTQAVLPLKKDYTKLELSFGYDYNCNTAYFDNIFLYRDTAQSYTYDENGNVVSTADYAKQQSTFEYTDNNLSKLMNPNGTAYEYTYDAKNNLTDAESNIGVKYHATYDNYGNVLTAETSSTESDSGEKITSSATYQNNGNYPHTVTDSRGNTTTYTYDTSRGLQTGVTDALGNSTTYNYNSLNDRLDSVSSGGSNVLYHYDTVGRLTSIDSPSGTIYRLDYDGFGNTRSISVGTQALVTNTYNTARGLLITSRYGNGQKINYSYDDLDRIKLKVYNNSIKVRFRYDKFGNLYEKQDLFTNTTYNYNYDLTGRIIGVVGSNNTSLNYVYDDFNRTKKYIAKFGDKSNVTEYIYGDSDISGQKDGLLYGVKQNGTQRISYAYDSLARLNTRTLNTTAPFVTQYSYHQGATSGTTTTFVKTVQNGNDTYEYAYDAVGNITQIKKNGSVYESYTYDSLNQLKTVTRGSDTHTYNYDNGGNILSVTLNGSTVKNYTYGDSTWKDKLTAYNGQTITYDQIGNPLQYRDGFNFTWSNGRQLTGITKGANNISYLYNADGLRASKTVNGITTDYYWLDGVLLGEKTGSNYITYLYDENGTAYGLIYNNAYAYYVFNAQGDVVALVSNSGGIVARYEYDAWGNILSITNGAGVEISQSTYHIANINPIRYRGYYYDYETGFYYLQSRYYDPVTQRFINADGQLNISLGILGFNQFSYCLNSPSNLVDKNGNKPGDWFDSMDEAARDAAIYLGNLSFANGWEYGTNIYSFKIPTMKILGVGYVNFCGVSIPYPKISIGIKNIYSYTKPTTQKDPWGVSYDEKMINFRVATLHTHPMGSGLGITKFSNYYDENGNRKGDIINSISRGITSYVHGPNGELRKYDPATNEDVLLFSDLPVSLNTPWLD